MRNRYLDDREAAIASISSKNMIQGLQALALLKMFLTAFSESPTYFENSYGPLTPIKFNFVSVAMALAIIVLLHPGGPYNIIPLIGSMPNLLNT
jgi:hypothetical protein